MGATSSISLGVVYISKDQINNKYIMMLYDKLQKLNHKIIIDEKMDNIEKSISQSNYIIICISPNTIRSFQQAIEINHALENKKNIIYIMTKESFNPKCNTELQSIVKENYWVSCYDETSVNNSFIEISYLLSAN
jgi:hypothetical protein